MEKSITPTRLSAEAGISLPYASQIINGHRRPSLTLAIAIFRKTGEKFGPVSGLSDADIATLARLEPAMSSDTAA